MNCNYEKEMRVLKRNGQEQEVSFDKILQRVKKLGSEVNPPLAVNYSQLIMKVINSMIKYPLILSMSSPPNSVPPSVRSI